MVYQEKTRNTNHLKERIPNAITRISQDVLMRVHHEWEKRIRMCFQGNGNHVEHVLKWQFFKKLINFPMYGDFLTTLCLIKRP
jgi:hypothetical protein